MSPVVMKFVVRALDTKTISAFTPNTMSPVRLTEILTTAAAKIPGTVVVPASFGADPKAKVHAAELIIGTGGVLAFQEDQRRHSLEQAVRTVADAIIDAGFGVFEPPDVDDSIP